MSCHYSEKTGIFNQNWLFGIFPDKAQKKYRAWRQGFGQNQAPTRDNFGVSKEVGGSYITSFL